MEWTRDWIRWEGCEEVDPTSTEANTVVRKDLHTVMGSLAATQLQTQGRLHLDIRPYLLLTIFFLVGTPQLPNIDSVNEEEDKENDEDENEGSGSNGSGPDD